MHGWATYDFDLGTSLISIPWGHQRQILHAHTRNPGQVGLSIRSAELRVSLSRLLNFSYQPLFSRSVSISNPPNPVVILSYHPQLYPFSDPPPTGEPITNKRNGNKTTCPLLASTFQDPHPRSPTLLKPHISENTVEWPESLYHDRADKPQ